MATDPSKPKVDRDGHVSVRGQRVGRVERHEDRESVMSGRICSGWIVRQRWRARDLRNEIVGPLYGFRTRGDAVDALVREAAAQLKHAQQPLALREDPLPPAMERAARAAVADPWVERRDRARLAAERAIGATVTDAGFDPYVGFTFAADDGTRVAVYREIGLTGLVKLIVRRPGAEWSAPREVDPDAPAGGKRRAVRVGLADAVLRLTRGGR